MTRKEKQEAAQKKRAALHLEIMTAMQDVFRARVAAGDGVKDALRCASEAADTIAYGKIKERPQESAMVYEVVAGICASFREKLLDKKGKP